MTKMDHQLETEYAGATLRLEISDRAEAIQHKSSRYEVHLFINGVHRDEARSNAEVISLRLASPLQTGYEQHEFIEATVTYTTDEICAHISSAEQVIADQQISRRG